MILEKLSNQQVHDFQRTVYDYDALHGRSLPWRETIDPYAIYVSEVMLQQTQVPRVIKKYVTWMTRFPTVYELAQTSLADVLLHWSGLGYNRRAKYLYDSARLVVQNFNGRFPTTQQELRILPGMGSYTSGAVCVFAYNQPVVLIETNVRTVYIHHFFKETVSDKELYPHVELTMDRANPRKWFNALMDYGTYLKTQVPNPSRKSTSYTRQSPLKGSVREVRGWILKQLTEEKPCTLSILSDHFDQERITNAIDGLVKDKLIQITQGGEIYLGR